MDESGIIEGQGDNGLVLGSSRKRFALRQQAGSRTWATVIECVSALGVALPPLIIFKGKTIQQQWFSKELDQFKEWFFTAIENAWTDDKIAIVWLREIFIPKTKLETPSKRLLVLDGYGSHTTDDFMWECFQNDIYLLFLPSHSLHVMQLLDVSVFSPLKGFYRRTLMEQEIQLDSSLIGKIIFLNCYFKAREAVMVESIIKPGWKASGLWPVNVARPLLNSFVARLFLVPLTPEKIGMKRKEHPDQGLSTPRASHQVRTMVRNFLDSKQIDPTVRLLFRKICKGLDE